MFYIKKLFAAIAIKALCISLAVTLFGTFFLKLEAIAAENPPKRPELLVVPPDAPGRLAVYGAGGMYTFLATGDETGSKFALFEFDVAPQSGPPLHIHSLEDESFYILEGDLTVQTGDKTTLVHPGSFVYLPKGRPHTFKNFWSNDKPVRTLAIATPSGLENFFEEAGQVVEDKSAPMPSFDSISKEEAKKYATLQKKYNSIIVGGGANIPTPLAGELLQDFLIVPPDAPRPSVLVSGSTNTFLATGRNTGGLFSIFDSVIPPQAQPPLPIGRIQDESFYVLEGELTIENGDETITATPGTFIYVPANTPYSIRNTGDKTARTVGISAPSGIEDYARDVGIQITRKSDLPPVRIGIDGNSIATRTDAVEELFAASEALDTKQMLDCFTENVKFQFNNAPPVVGQTQLTSFMDDSFASLKSIDHNIKNTWKQGNAVVVEMDATQTYKNGEVKTFPVVYVFQLEDSKIQDMRVYALV